MLFCENCEKLSEFLHVLQIVLNCRISDRVSRRSAISDNSSSGNSDQEILRRFISSISFGVEIWEFLFYF